MSQIFGEEDTFAIKVSPPADGPKDASPTVSETWTALEIRVKGGISASAPSGAGKPFTRRSTGPRFFRPVGWSGTWGVVRGATVANSRSAAKRAGGLPGPGRAATGFGRGRRRKRRGDVPGSRGSFRGRPFVDRRRRVGSRSVLRAGRDAGFRGLERGAGQSG